MIYIIGGLKYSLTKTRAAVSFACYQASTNNKNVALIDLSTNAVSGKVSASNTLLGVDQIKLESELTKEYLDKISAIYDVIVIDSGLGDRQQFAMELSDTYIVPFDVNDLGLWLVWSLTNIETMICRAQSTNPDLKCYSFLVTEGHRSLIDPELIKTLRKSQYLTYLDSPALNQMLTGKLTKDLAEFYPT